MLEECNKTKKKYNIINTILCVVVTLLTKKVIQFVFMQSGNW